MASGTALHPNTSQSHCGEPRTIPAPNILLIVADDHRADALGVRGNRTVSTPVLDRLAAGGFSFTRASIAGGLMPAVCSPSRAALMTGLSPFRADAAPRLVGAEPYEVKIPADACTLPERFRAAGYETFLTGKWHNDVDSLLRSFTDGKNIFHGGMCDHRAVPVRDLDEIRRDSPPQVGKGFSTELFCGAAAEFIRSRRTSDRPFFVCVALTSPHDPRTPPEAFHELYDPATVPLPANFRTAHPFDNGELEVRDERLLEHPLVESAVREALADYYGLISHQDAWIGRIQTALVETGKADSTIVLYLSDHGLALGSHGLLGKQNVYEHSLRVPAILAGPGVPQNRRFDGMVYTFDLYATLCELAGLSPPAGVDSRSLVPAFATNAAPIRESLGAAYMDRQRMVTDGRWKLIVYRVGGEQRIQLFDLETDPGECSDRSEDPAHAVRIDGLWKRLEAWQHEFGDRWFAPLNGKKRPRHLS